MTVGELRKVITGLPDNCTAFMVVNGMALDIDICTGDFIQSVVKQTAFLQLIKDCLSDWHIYVWFNDAKHEVTRIEEDKYKDGMYFVWFDNEDEEYWMNEALTVVQMMVK